ncbi:MAG TPA: hypothetical protein VHD87_02740 [Acidimicrobiales bacterium]|nr:hypothetical protein [Acidimicrobiales bacterium]
MATRQLVPVADGPVLASLADAVVAVTPRSVWVITACSYMRSPRDAFAERLADEKLSLWGRLDDDVWHRHHGAFWRERNGGFIINLRPDAGPVDGYGIVTGLVEVAAALDVELMLHG